MSYAAGAGIANANPLVVVNRGTASKVVAAYALVDLESAWVKRLAAKKDGRKGGEGKTGNVDPKRQAVSDNSRPAEHGIDPSTPAPSTTEGRGVAGHTPETTREEHF